MTTTFSVGAPHDYPMCRTEYQDLDQPKLGLLFMGERPVA